MRGTQTKNTMMWGITQLPPKFHENRLRRAGAAGGVGWLADGVSFAGFWVSFGMHWSGIKLLNQNTIPRTGAVQGGMSFGDFGVELTLN